MDNDMTTLEQAARQALEALNGLIPYVFLSDEAQWGRYYDAITALRQALDQAEKQEPCNPSCAPGYCYCEEMEEQPKQEPVAYSYTSRITGRQTFSLHPQPPHLDSDSWEIKPLYTEPPQLEQNEFNPDWDAMSVMVEEQQRMAKRIEELEATTLQPTRQWVGLTDKQIVDCWNSVTLWTANPKHDFARTIEATLKERNA